MILLPGNWVRGLLCLGVVHGLLLWGQSFWCTSALAQQAENPELPQRVARYHAALLQRPARGTLFERFCDGWLDEGTAADLELFLRQRAEAETGSGLADDLLLTFFLNRQGNDVGALKVLETGLKTTAEEPMPMVVVAWYEKAKIAMRLSDLDQAGQDLAKAADLLADGKADDAMAVDADMVRKVGLLRGKLLARMGRRDEALAVWSAVAQRFPEDRDLQLDVIDLQAEAGLYDQALEGNRQLIDSGSDTYEKTLLQLERVELLQNAERSDEAVQELITVLQASGQGSWIEREALARFERHFRLRDNLSGLAKALQERVESEPQRLALLMARARVLAELGEDDNALATWAQVLRLTPGQREIREQYVAALGDMGRRDEAVNQLQSLIKLHADDAELYAQLAELQWRNRDAEAAQASVEKFVAVAGESEVSFARAVALLGQYRRAGAVEKMYRRWLKLTPESAAASDGLASFLHSEGRRDEAVELWKQLAEGTELGNLLFVAERLLGNSEARAAYDILMTRRQDFGSDFAYLGKLAEAALAAGEALAEEALPLARQRLVLAKDESALSEAIGLAATAARRADGDGAVERKLVQELSSKASAQRSAVETCLLVELLRRAMRPAETENLLVTLLERDAEDKQGANEEAAEMWARRQLVRWYEGQQQYRRAAGILQEVVENVDGGVRGGDAATLQSLVNLARRAGDLTAARHWLGEWKKAVPGSAQPWMIEVSVLEDDGDYEAALKILQDVTRRFDDVDAASSRLVKMYQQLGRVAEAEAVVWQLYSKEEKLERRLDWARRLAQLAVEADQSAGISPGRGRGGRVDALLEKFSERQRSNRRSVSPLLALAAVHKVVDNAKERRRVLQQAVVLEPENVGLLHELAALAEAEAQTSEALSWLEQARKYDTSLRSSERLARLHLSVGQFEKAALLLREADDAKGGADLATIEEMAVSLMTIGEWPRAASLLRPFVEGTSRGNDYRLHYLHGIALEESERYDAAAAAFLRCVRMEQELSDARRGGAAQVPANVDEEATASILPAEAEQIRQASKQCVQAYSYRWGSPSGWLYGLGGELKGLSFNNQPALFLQRFIPPSVEDARWWARAHLATLAMDDEAQIRDNGRDWRAALKAEGMTDVLLDSLAGAGKAMTGVPLVGDILDQRYADNFAYQASQLNADSSESHQLDSVSHEEVLRAMRVFEEHQRADLAIFSGVRRAAQLRYSAPEGAELLHKETVRLLKQWQPPLRAQIFDTWMTSVLRRLAGYDGGLESFSDEELQVVRQRVLRWRPSRNHRSHSDQFWKVMLALSHVADSAAMKAKLEDFLKMQAEHEFVGRQATDLQSLIQSNRRDEGDSSKLVNTPGYPSGFLLALQTMLKEAPRRKALNDSWSSLVAGVEDDALAACFAKILKLPGELSIRLIRLQTGGAADISQAFVLGVNAEEMGDWPAALHWFEKLRASAEAELADGGGEEMDRARWLADSSIMFLGIDRRRGREVREAGKLALMRMLKEPNPSLETSLAVVIGVDGYGLVNELRGEFNRHQAAIRSAQPVATAASGVQWGGPFQQLGRHRGVGAFARIERLAEAGRKEALVRVVADQLPMLVHGRLSSWADGRYGRGSSGEESPLGLIRKLNLEDEIVAEVRSRLRPSGERGSEAEGFLAQARFGALCLELGRWSEAAEIFRQLRKSRPDDRVIGLRLVEALCGLEGGAVEAGEELRRVGDFDERLWSRSDRRFLEVIVGSLVDSALQVELRLGVVEMVVAYFEQVGIDEQNSSLWRRMRTVLISPMMGNGTNLAGLAVRGQGAGRSAKAAISRRQAIYERLCQVALSDPQLAAEGFAGLRLLNDLAEGSDAELVELASDVLAVMPEAVFVTPSARISSTGVVGRNYDVGREPDPFADPRQASKKESASSVGPIQVLVAEAARQQKPEWIYSEVLPRLQKRGKEGAQVYAATKAWADLWFCEQEQFVDAVEALRKVPGVGESKLFWGHLERVLAERNEVNFDLGEELLITLRDGGRKWMAIQRLRGYLDDLYDNRGPAALTDYLRRLFANVAKELLADQQRDPQDLVWSSRNVGGGRPDSIDSLMGVVAGAPTLVMPALVALSETERADLFPLEEYAATGKLNFSRESRDERALFLQQVASLGSLLDLPILASDEAKEEADDSVGSADSRGLLLSRVSLGLRSRGSASEASSRTLIGAAINAAVSGSTEDRGVIWASVQRSEASTPFGQRLAKALLAAPAGKGGGKEDQVEPGDLVQVFLEARSEIEALPEGRRRGFARLAMDLLTADRLSRKPEHIETLRWLAGEAGDPRLQWLDRMAEAKYFSDLEMERDEAISKFVTILPFTLLADEKRSRSAFENLLELEVAVGDPESATGTMDPFSGQVTQSRLDLSEPVFQGSLLAVEIAALRELAVRKNPRWALSSGFFSQFSRSLQQQLPSEGDAEEVLRQRFEWLKDVLLRLDAAGSEKAAKGVWITQLMAIFERAHLGGESLASTVIEWLKEPGNTLSDELKEEVLAAGWMRRGRLYREKMTRLSSIVRSEEESKQQPEVEAADAELLKAISAAEARVVESLNDENTPLELRLGLCDFWLKMSGRQARSPVVVAAAREVLAECWKVKPDRDSGWVWSWVVQEVSAVQEEAEKEVDAAAPDWWREKAGALAEYLRTRYFEEPEMGGALPPAGGYLQGHLSTVSQHGRQLHARLDAERRQILPSLFALFVALGQEAAVKDCLREHIDLLNPADNIWLMLIREGMFDGASELFAKRQSDLGRRNSGQRFDAALATRAQDYLASFESFEDQLLARTLLEVLRDPNEIAAWEKAGEVPTGYPSDWKPWQERMMGLAAAVEQVVTTGGKDGRNLAEPLRFRLLSALSQHPPALELAKTFLGETAAGMSLTRLERITDSSRRKDLFEVLYRVVEAEMKAGEFERWFALRHEARLMPSKSPRKEAIEKRLDQLTMDLQEEVLSGAEDTDIDVLVAFRIEHALRAAQSVVDGSGDRFGWQARKFGLEELNFLIDRVGAGMVQAGDASRFPIWLQEIPQSHGRAGQLLCEIAWLDWDDIREMGRHQGIARVLRMQFRDKVFPTATGWPSEFPMPIEAAGDVVFGDVLVERFLEIPVVSRWWVTDKFTSSVVRLLSLLAKRPDDVGYAKAREVFWHAVRLQEEWCLGKSEQDLTKLKWTFANGWTYPASLVNDLIASSDDFEELDLGLDLLDAAEQEGEYLAIHSWSGNYNHRNRLTRLLTSEGQDFELEGSLIRSVERLGSLIGKRSADVQAKIFWEFIACLEAVQREALVKLVSEKLAMGEAVPEHWRELAMAMAFADHVEGRSASLPVDWLGHYLAVLEDEALPLSRRFSLLQHWLAKAGRGVEIDAAALFAGMKVASQLAERDGAVHGYVLSILVRRFVRGMDSDGEHAEEWHRAAKEMLAAWSQITEEQNGEEEAPDGPADQKFSPELDAVLAMRELAHVAKDAAAVAAIDARFGDDLIKNSRLLAHHVRFGEFDQTLKLIERNRRWMSSPYFLGEVKRENTRTHYSSALDANAALLLPKIDDESTRYLVAGLLAATPDPEAWELDSRGDFPRRPERMREHAERFRNVKFASLAGRVRALSEATLRADGMRELRDELHALAREIEIATIAQAKTSLEREENIRILVGAVLADVLTGEGGQGGKAFGELVALLEKAKIDKAADHARDHLFRVLRERFRAGLANFPVEERRRWRELCGTMIDSAANWADTTFARRLAVATVLLGASTEDGWQWSQSGDRATGRLAARVKRNREWFFSDLRYLLFDPVSGGDGPVDWQASERQALMTKLIEDEAFRRIFHDSVRLYREMLDEGWLTESELIAKAEDWCERMPRGGLAMLEIAEWNCVAKRLPDAESWLAKARQWQAENPTADVALEHRSSLWRTEYVELGLALCSGKLRRVAEALPLLAPAQTEIERFSGVETSESRRVQAGPAGLKSLLKAAGWGGAKRE